MGTAVNAKPYPWNDLSGTTAMTIYKFRFDFDVGTLVKSPCKNCKDRDEFPECMTECKWLDRIQTVLAGTRSCTRNR